ncbi:hypothetical protein HDV05_002744 [Chytridiales sp. JEL 0842]|nr:hypothetical protein HDV05_002744 [Chytridiales sp. JEL 0842]
MTVNDINTNASLAVPGAQLALSYSTHARTIAGGVRAAMAFGQQGAVGLIGEHYSAATAPMSLALNVYSVFQCSGGAASDGLSGKSNYQLFFRTISTEKLQAYTMADYIFAQGWKKVALVTSNTAYGLALAQYFVERCNTLKIQIIRNEAYVVGEREYKLQMPSLKNSNARIMVLLGLDADMVHFFRAARKFGMIGPKYVYLGPDSLTTMRDLVYDDSKGYSWQDRQNIEGLITISPFENGGAEMDRFSTRFQQQYNKAPARYATFYRDCLISLSAGFKTLLSNGATLQAIANRTTGATIPQFLNFTLVGASGPLVFDRNGDRKNDFMVYNVKGGVQNRAVVATLNSTNQASFAKVGNYEVTYNGGSTVPPPDGVRIYRSLIEYNSPFGLFAIIAFMVMTLITVISTGVVLVAWNTPPVKAMSLPFTLLCAAGLTLEYFSVFGWLGYYENGMTCTVQTWLGWMGYSLLMQSVLPKCFRIYRIFGSKRATGAYLKDIYLVPLSFIITGINAAILGAWTAIDRPMPVLNTDAFEGVTYYQCQSISSTVQNNFNIILLVYNGALLLCALWLAYATRNVSSTYRETPYILYTSQIILICAVVVLALVNSPGGNFDTQVVIRLILVLFATSFTYAMTLGRVALATMLSIRSAELANRSRSTPSTLGSSSAGATSSTGGGKQSGTAHNIKAMAAVGDEIREFKVKVKDGVRLFTSWSSKTLYYLIRTKAIMIVDQGDKIGETVAAADLSVSEAPGINKGLEMHFGSKVRIVQFASDEDFANISSLVFNTGK